MTRASQRLGLLRGQRYFNHPFARLAPHRTYAAALTLEAPFDLVRLAFVNEGPEPYAVTEAAIAPSAALGDGVSADGAWVQVTFNARGQNRPVPSPDGQTTQLTVPGTADPNIPALAWSDWMRVAALPPRDGALPWLMCRARFDGPACAAFPTLPHMLSYNATPAHRGRQSWGFQADADQVLTGGGLRGCQPDGAIIPHLVQYYTRARGATVLCIGDSLTNGLGALCPVSSWGMRATAAISAPHCPVSYVNSGWNGQSSPEFYRNGHGLLAADMPEIVCIATYSPNDVFFGDGSQANADAAFSRALDLAHHVIRGGGTPVLIAPAPWGGGPINDAVRQTILARVRSLTAGGLAVLDFDRVLTNGHSPAGMRVEYDSGDGLHPNDAGYDAMAEQAIQLFRQILAD